MTCPRRLSEKSGHLIPFEAGCCPLELPALTQADLMLRRFSTN